VCVREQINMAAYNWERQSQKILPLRQRKLIKFPSPFARNSVMCIIKKQAIDAIIFLQSKKLKEEKRHKLKQ